MTAEILRQNACTLVQGGHKLLITERNKRNPFVPQLFEYANNIDPDQLHPNAASEQDLRCLLLQPGL